MAGSINNLARILQMRDQVRPGQPLFTEEGPQFYAAAMKHNLPFATKGPYMTTLPPEHEAQFRQWLKTNNIPFDPNAQLQDYDMRGYWLALQKGQTEKRASNLHFPDTYKTPADTTFSAESKYANKAPFVWKGNDLIDLSTGQTVFKGK